MNEMQTSGEIDLIHLIETVWDGKWKIIAITVACVLGVFGFQVSGFRVKTLTTPSDSWTESAKQNRATLMLSSHVCGVSGLGFGFGPEREFRFRVWASLGFRRATLILNS